MAGAKFFHYIQFGPSMYDLGYEVLIAVIKVVILLFGVVLPGASACVYFERKISAWIQLRVGPNRVGPLGLLQPIADVVKLLLKEDIIPAAADKMYHFLAPLISITVAVSVFAVVPFGHYIMIGGEQIYLSIAPHINVSVLYVLAITSIGVYGITLAGWSSNNKYSLLGGLRSASQMISYELSMGLSLIGVLMISGSLNLNEIVIAQAGMQWNVFYQPLGFVIFLIASFAETNRAPFDLPEAEPELVGGYHTEYSGMKFGIFFLAEYANMIASSAMIVTFFFGGWQVPFLPELLGIQEGSLLLGLLQLGAFTAKVAAFLFFFIWVRWSLPRFRYDQLMNLGWKVLLPLALLNITVTGIVMYFLK
jgi:NADH-quinone oxidoreductase subunit H